MVIRLRRLNDIWMSGDGISCLQLTLAVSVSTFDSWLLGEGSFC